MTREPGWECPRCQRVWAPRIAACGACNTAIDHKPPVIGHFPEWSYTADDRSFVD